jgi:DNA-binding response OmpR family regulator
MLSSSSVLVAEDDPLVAQHLADLLSEAEAEVLGPFATLQEARQFVNNGRVPDAALLDFNLSDGLAVPLLEALAARRVFPALFTVGRMCRMLFGNGIQSLSRCRSPFGPRALSRNCGA